MKTLSGRQTDAQSPLACGLGGAEKPPASSAVFRPARSLRGFPFSTGLQPHSERDQGPFLGARKKRDGSQIHALTDRLSTWSPHPGENQYPRIPGASRASGRGKEADLWENRMKPLNLIKHGIFP